MKNWRVEFPNFPVEDMPTLPEGWVDDSYHNDACPSFRNDKLKAVLFIDHRDPAMREFSTRFVAYNVDGQGNIEADLEPIVEGDNTDSVLAELNAKRAR